MIVSFAYLNNVQAKIPQRINITVNRLALCGNIVGFQVGDDLVGGHGMIFVRVLQQVLHDVDNLQLLK